MCLGSFSFICFKSSSNYINVASILSLFGNWRDDILMFRRSGLSVITSHPAGKHIFINFLLMEGTEVAVRLTSDTSGHKNLNCPICENHFLNGSSWSEPSSLDFIINKMYSINKVMYLYTCILICLIKESVSMLLLQYSLWVDYIYHVHKKSHKANSQGSNNYFRGKENHFLESMVINILMACS